MFRKKRVRQMKNFVMYQAYFPDAGLFRTREGYAKAWYLEDIDAATEEEYELAVSARIIVPEKGNTQICHVAEKDVIIITVPAGSPDEALVALEGLKVPGSPVPLEEWFDLLAQSMQFRPFADKRLVGAVGKRGKPSVVLFPKIQPYFSSVKYDTKGKEIKISDTKILDINDKYVRTVILTNFPGYIYPSLLTEILRFSESISSSLFLRQVDKGKCIAAFDRFPVQMSSMRMRAMKDRLSGKEQLYHSCLLISAYADTKDEVNGIIGKVRDMAARYLAGVNVLEHQQAAAFRSMAPLGIDYIRCNKVLEGGMLAGLTPLSWMRHVSNSVSYGVDKVTGVEILYNRLMTRDSGFILGSDGAYTERRIVQEIRQFQKERPDLRIAIFTTDAAACPLLSAEFGVRGISGPLVCGNWNTDFEVLRAVTISACGHNGELAKEKRRVMEETLEERASSFREYADWITERNVSMGRQLSGITDSAKSKEEMSSACVYQCGKENARYAERIGILMQSIAAPDADLVYVVSAEALALSNMVKLCQKKKPGILWTWASVTKDGAGLRKMYIGKGTGEAIQEARFLDISRHEVSDRVQLRGLLDFGRNENAVLAAQDGGTGLLVAGNTVYIYDDREEN